MGVSVMIRVVLIVFMLFVSLAQAEPYEQWAGTQEKPVYVTDPFKAGDLRSRYQLHDFSPVFMPKNEFLGYIGKNFRRLDLAFLSIERSEGRQYRYDVRGYSTVNNNRCDFEGVIYVSQIREFEKIRYGIDNEDVGIKSQGMLFGSYVFNEKSEQKHSGVFEGKMALYWYLGHDGTLHLDDTRAFADSYKNNQYVGTWKQYNKLQAKPANWGESRIPFSKGLDIGAGEFVADRARPGWK